MGFKRTNEGRVFFQGLSEQSNEQLNEELPEPRKLDETPKSAPSQMQILSLLKSLNERLKTTQAERNYMRTQLEAYREVIEALEDKSDKNEQAYAKLEKALMSGEGAAQTSAPTPTIQRTEALMKETLKEMSETRRLLLEVEDKAERASRSTGALQKMQQDQAQKMAKTTASYAQMVKRLKENEHKQDNMSEQLEDTISQQAKMMRKIDKVAEDRARFMRKIERIEETVIQTRDALNAKAMVLLTDQDVASDSAAQDQTLGQALLQQKNRPQAEMNDVTAAAMMSDTAMKSGANRGRYMQIAAVGTLLAAAVFTGWFVSELNNPSDKAAAAQNTVFEDVVAAQSGQNQASASINRVVRAPSTSEQAATQPQQWRVENDISAYSEAAPAAGSESYSAAQQSLDSLDDIGTLDLQDEQALTNMLETNPDAVATALNTIEPGTPNLEPMQQQAALQPQAEAAPPVAKAPAFDPANYTPVSGPDALSADPDLPEVIKEVEAQAFAGSPEAQHDLAAIYTAGHAGVTQDYDRAAYWFRKAADQGVANARYNLGVLHHQGLGVRPDMKEAIYWYDQAAAIGHPEAQYNLGIAYIEGIGVTYTPAKAADNFEKAARNGVMEAAYNLGLIYENGLLGAPAPDKALMWYKQAADQGSPEAKAALEQLAKALDIRLEDVNRLVEDMQGSAKQSSAAPVVEKAAPVPVSAAQAEPLRATASDLDEFGSSLAGVEQEFAQITLAQVQEQLMRLGLYPGPADGVLGPLTSDAIRAYQDKNNLSVNGQATTELLSHMLSNG